MAANSLGIPLRKRTVRACDQCRRRKTKCNGELTCKSCCDLGLECSYGHKIRQARGPSYVAHLEKKLKYLESQLRRASGSTTLKDEDESPMLEIDMDSKTWDLPPFFKQDPSISTSFDQDCIHATDPLLSHKNFDDVVDTINSARGDETASGNEIVSVFRGNSTGVGMFRNLHRFCNSFGRFTTDLDGSSLKMANALDRPFPIHCLSLDSMTNVCLPPEAQVHRWVDLAFSEAFNLWPFIDRQLFNFHVQRLFRQQNFGRETGDRDNLALIHAVLALGQRYDSSLSKVGGDCFESGDVRGIKHFDAARHLVRLTECSRSVTSVQTVLCFCIYLKSVSALREVHTYVTMAGHAAHQLGLHAAASASHLPRRERLIRQRVYIAVRMFDAYVTSSLGLPRNFRAIEPAGEAKEDYCKDLPESVLAANANMELLEILGEAVEKTYFTDVVTNDNGSTAVQYDKLREVATKLERWERRYSVFAQAIDDNLATCTRSQLLLRYSKCYVLLMLYCPFVHHVTKSMEGRSANAYASGSKSIEAAIESVRTAEALETRGFLNEAYPLVLNVLAMAATTLLVVELGAPDDVTAETVKRTSRNAKTLLEGLAMKNSSAAQCLESLMPLYEQHAQTAFPATPTIEEVMEDFTLFTTENSDVPLFNSNLDPLDFNLLVEPPSNIVDTFNYPTSWPDWECCDFTTPNFVLSL